MRALVVFSRAAARIVPILALIWTQSCSAAGRPNILLILADDLGYGDLRCYNPDSKISTRHLDGLAAQGLRFSDAHSPSSVCTPTRYGLLTGRYAWRTTLKQGVLNGYDPLLIERARVTLPHMLKERGYTTACIGKWHLGLGTALRTDYAQPLQPGPRATGFDYFFGIPASLDMPPYVFIHNEAPTLPPTNHIRASAMRRQGGGGFWREGPIAPEFRHEDVLPQFTARAVDYLRAQKADQPFFLYLAFNSPHTPWMPAPEFRGRSEAGWYGDFVAQTDAAVGRVLQTLAETRLERRTLVIFTSDNGAHWLPADIREFGHRANLVWRGQKADIWEGGNRVPFIVRWPGKVIPGKTNAALVCLTDLFATLAELTGAALGDNTAEDSYSFLAALTGKRPRQPIRKNLVHHSVDGTFAIREGSWKLCGALGSHGFTSPKNLMPKPGEAKGQLYDLANDPREERNLWLDRPDLVARLGNLLEEIQARGRSRH